MKDLRIATGVEEYRLNGKLTVHFNPTDVTFLERLRKTSETLSEWQNTLSSSQVSHPSHPSGVTNPQLLRCSSSPDKTRSAGLPSGNGEELVSFANDLDAKMRAELDTLFDVPVCEELFGDVNLCASADGFPVWANLINALTETVEEAIRAELAAREKRIAKYTEKYAMDPKGEG